MLRFTAHRAQRVGEMTRYWPNQIEQWITDRQIERLKAGEDIDWEDAELWPTDVELAWLWHCRGYNPLGVYRGNRCPVCGVRVQQIRRAARQRIYCRNACKQRAYRQRKADREDAFFRQLAARGELWSPSPVDRIRDLFGWW